MENLSHLFDAIILIRWNYLLPLQRLSGTQRDGAAATTNAPGRGTRGDVLGDLPDLFKKATASRQQPPPPHPSISLDLRQQPLAEPEAVFDGGNG
jgi:hypothetical protein